MNYGEIFDIAQNDDEIQHLRALISARGAKMDEEVDTDFLSMLAEEGYNIATQLIKQIHELEPVEPEIPCPELDALLEAVSKELGSSAFIDWENNLVWFNRESGIVCASIYKNSDKQEEVA